jgi:phosphopantetheine--protein transferase-like protein
LIVGVGIDALEIHRMARELARDREGFTESLFLPDESARCERSHDPAGAFALCFAAKEALIKALALARVDFGIYREMEVCPDGAGSAHAILTDRALEAAGARRVKAIRLSLCRTAGLAMAAAVLTA